jgi:hypothetical protein
MTNLSYEELLNFYEKYRHRVQYLKEYKKEYYKTETGRERQKEASKKYYYRKNNKYHPIYNPNNQSQDF